ncbi:MAG TPA: DegT/DnrJ/EryC1/StrS family aminotransferase [Methylomirabilota bacterium]|nr:DegT/DnrJ/EryC1/StrS family aminotransferase [Methylomirabilota bacterium]
MTETAALPIPVFQPAIGVDTIKAVVDALHAGWLGMGAVTQAFEEGVARYLGLDGRWVVATNTGTSALHLGLLAAGVGPGSEVITPAFNFVADHQAIIAAGAAPVLCDVDEATLGLDLDKVEALVGPRTRAIVPLHFGGVAGHVTELYALAERHRLRVVEDATHAFGTRVAGRAIGAFGDVTCFSFDPVKVITSIDGGAVIVGDAVELERVRHLRFLGIDRETHERYKNSRAWQYDVVSQGFRYHLTNINAAVGLSQLARVDEFIANRRASCRLYTRLLAGVAGVRCPATNFEDVSPFIYTVRVPAAHRDGLIEHLRDRGIATGIHFLPAQDFTYLKGCRRGDLSVTERVTREILTLPLHTHMPASTVERVAGAIREHLGRR